jgi:hypothetical protein
MKFRGDDIIFGDTLGPRLYLTPRRVLNGARGSHLNRNALSGPGLTTFPWTWPRLTQEVHERPDDTHATAAAATAYLRVRLILNLFADLTHILSQHRHSNALSHGDNSAESRSFSKITPPDFL